MTIFLLFLWFLISIAFITTLIITIVKAARRKKVKGILITTIILFVVGLICFIGSIVVTPSNDDYTVSKSEDSNVSETSKSNDKKTLNIGDKIRVGGVDVKVANAEFVQPDSEYSTPDKERVLKITYEFKNNDENQVLVDNTDFNVTVDNTSQDRFYGMDNNDGFTKKLNQGNTYTGYEHYDVPNSDEYKVEMDFMPSYKSYKANWVIKNSDIQ